jgi:hypothetical protein
MALAGPPRSHENELPPWLFSHQYLEGKFSETRAQALCLPLADRKGRRMFARGVHWPRGLTGHFVILLVLLLGSGCGGGGGSQEDDSAADTTTAGGGAEQASEADLDAALEKPFQESGAPGVIAAVQTPEYTWIRALGVADRTSKEPMTPDMHHRIAIATVGEVM